MLDVTFIQNARFVSICFYIVSEWIPLFDDYCGLCE